MHNLTAPPSGYLFEIVGLEKTFEDGRVQALRSVTFGAVQEEFVAITGPSGCGKTLLLQMLGARLNGLLREPCCTAETRF